MLQGGGGVEFQARTDEAVEFDRNRTIVEVAVEIEEMEFKNDFRRAVLADRRGVADVGNAVEDFRGAESATGRIDTIWGDEVVFDGQVGGRAGENGGADVVAVNDIALDGKRSAKKTLCKFQVAVLDGLADAGATDRLAVDHDIGHDADSDAVRLA